MRGEKSKDVKGKQNTLDSQYIQKRYCVKKKKKFSFSFTINFLIKNEIIPMNG